MANLQRLDGKTIQELLDIANKLRIHVINATQASNSGHPTSCSSIAEIISVLFFHVMRYKVSNPKQSANDRLVLSKGHAAPILYAAWAEAGLFPVSDLLNLRKLESDLEGHPTPRLGFIDVATGSLGQGLSVAAGMAYVGKNYDKASYRVYCILGDGESAEGSVWEAIHFSSHYKLDNLCAIFDINRLGQSEPTSLGHNMDIYRQRLEAFGWNAIVLDGHNIEQLVKGFITAKVNRNKPTALLAKTIKGKNFPKIENQENWHGKPLGGQAEAVLEYLQSSIKNQGPLQLKPQEPYEDDTPVVTILDTKLVYPPGYALGASVATRAAYGTALAKLVRNNPSVIALDGDMKNSTFSEEAKKVDSSKFIECFIAEQNLVSVAIGAACRDRAVVFVSTFASFLTRAFDQIRMGAISKTNVNFCGSHCGVSIGEDGPSQMGLEDIAMFRSIPDCTIFYPSDAIACERAVELAANTPGICYIRTNRPATPVIYPNTAVFQIGSSNILRKSDKDRVLVIAAGITLHEALNAATQLEKDGVHIRVLDPFTIKPLDREAIIYTAKKLGGKIITVEDHYPEGGLGEAVLSIVAEEKGIAVRKMAVPKIPHSGPPSVLLDYYGISAKHIVNAVHDFLS